MRGVAGLVAQSGGGEYTFDLRRILMADFPAAYLLEVVLRSTVVFAAAFAVLRLLGKRSIGQLSPFDLVIIIALGTSVGDPMLYDDVPIVPALLVIATVVALTLVLGRLAVHQRRVDRMVDSQPTVLVRDGVIDEAALRAEVLTRNELMGALRLHEVERIEEVRLAVLETSGAVSVLRKDSALPDEREMPSDSPWHLLGAASPTGGRTP